MGRYACLFAATLLLLAGCSSVTVNRDYDEAVDFAALRTYAWQHAEQPQTGDARIDNDLIDERVRAAVDAELAAKGFARVEAAEADFQVAYFIDFKQRIGGSSVSFGVGAGNYGRYSGVGYNTAISDYEEGRLTIDIVDPHSGKNIWRGVGRRTTYEGGTPKKTTRIVNGAVARILKKFPPKT